MKYIKIFEESFEVNAQNVEKAIEFGCSCLKLDHCQDSERTFQSLLGMNEELVDGHEYTLQIKDTSVKLVKSQMPADGDGGGSYPGANKFKYVLNYA